MPLRILLQISLKLLLLACSVYIPAAFGQKTFYSEKIRGWENRTTEESAEPVYSVFLIGDVKYPSKNPEVIDLLQNHIQQKGEKSAVVFLGDIVYPLGVPDDEEDTFDAARTDLDTLLSRIMDYKGRIVFLPGNHDWERGRKDGWERVINEEKYIENALGREDVYYPGDGCPGPVEIELTEDVVLVIFDTQWLLQKNDKPGPESDCGFEDEDGLFIQIEDALRRNKDKKVIFCAHHPLFSAGNHGGYFPASRLLFPMLDVNKNLYIPLPGFIYTGYRKYFGDIQDLANPEYKDFRNKLLNIFSEYPNVIYAAGHEHNLQYKVNDSLFHVISGGGGEGKYVARKPKKADFAIASKGFSVLDFFDDGNVQIRYIIPDTAEWGKVVFQDKLFNKTIFNPALKQEQLQNIDYSDSTVTRRLNDRYEKGKCVRFLMGNNYRDVWNQKVTVPVFDIGKAKGGLKIIKRGGGQQTRSVRLEDHNGKQYVLRSVNKYVGKALGKELQNTVAEDVVQDAISASQPYAALTVPKLADAVGVYHTNPKIVWVPNDPRLGIYRKDLANNFFLFEERPDDDRSDIASFGRSTKIRSTNKMLEKLREEQDHRVDQISVVKARLFDILLGDWDRHDDQWRWASFKKGDFRIYKPIPRDRDQVYFVNQGLIMWLVRQNFIMPKFQGFDYKIRNVKGLGFNARYFDRSFMTEPGLQDWLEITDTLQAKLTDSIIHSAITEMPPEIYKISGPQIEDKLRTRLADLGTYARDYYLFLSKGVDVVGTDDRELFEVHRKENGNTDVTVTALSDKKGKKKFVMYHREFKKDETREIRLYGLKDEDKFVLDGSGKKGIKVRIIGGKGDDTIIDHSKVNGLCRKTLVYDRKDKDNYFLKGPETRLKLSKDPAVNRYNRKQFKYDKAFPLVSGGYNLDDGIYVGGGVKLFHYNFRDSTIQSIKANVAFETGAFGFAYSGLFTSFSQKLDLEMDAVISMPKNVDNFYGLGNETVKITDNVTFYRVRYQYINVNPRLKRTIHEHFNYSMGLLYQYFKVDDTAGRYIGDLKLNKLDTAIFQTHQYVGLNFRTDLDTRDSKIIPKRGIYWQNELLGYYSLAEDGKNFAKFRTDLRFYLSFRKDPRVVFVFRFGGASNFGDYYFYHANFLGRKYNLRGFRNNRFAGDQSFYQNTEIRIKALNLSSYFFKGQAGFLVHNDIGRVWVKGEDSEKWHDGYGFGIWVSPFNYLAVSAAYSISKEDKLFEFNFNFTF